MWKAYVLCCVLSISNLHLTLGHGWETGTNWHDLNAGGHLLASLPPTG